MPASAARTWDATLVQVSNHVAKTRSAFALRLKAKPRGRAETAVMHALLRAAALTAVVSGALSCAASHHASASAQNEYYWALLHGGCDCAPVAYATGSAAPSWVDGETLARYVHDKTVRCGSRQFVVVAFGDGGSDLAGDMNLARARATPFVRRLSKLTYRRLDTIVLAGPHIAHPSTLAIVCPIDRLPAQDSFKYSMPA